MKRKYFIYWVNFNRNEGPRKAKFSGNVNGYDSIRNAKCAIAASYVKYKKVLAYEAYKDCFVIIRKS